jgi:hypothetical protein
LAPLQEAQEPNLFIFLAYVPVVSAFTILVSERLGTYTPSFVFAGLWMVMFAVVGSRLSTWRCPRCGKWFSGFATIGSEFSQAAMNALSSEESLVVPPRS